MPVRHLFVFLLLLPLFWGCEKEPLAPGDAAPGSALIGERSGPSQAEIQEALAAIDSIKAFKEQVDRWRAGQELSKSLDAGQAAELVETAINFYISKPGQAYEDYTTVVDSVTVPTSASTWSGAQIAAFFNAMKGRLVHHFDQVSGTDKAYQFVDMGAPVVDGGSSKVYFVANIGRGEVTEDATPTVPSHDPSTCDCTIGVEIRWAQADLGETDGVNCHGSAARGIGVLANQRLGFVNKNLAPDLVNPANDNPIVNTNVVITSPIDHVQTNFLGARFPLGGTGANGQAPPPLFKVSLFFQTPEWAFPFLLNPTGSCNEAPDYKRFGQFAIHADIAFGDDRPDESCFCVDKFVSYIDRNIEAGQFYRPKVNEALNLGPFPSIDRRRQLISTIVAPNPAQPTINDEGITIRRQEHATYHFYAAIALIFEDDDPDPGVSRLTNL